jgi:hypothetical protein
VDTGEQRAESLYESRVYAHVSNSFGQSIDCANKQQT